MYCSSGGPGYPGRLCWRCLPNGIPTLHWVDVRTLAFWILASPLALEDFMWRDHLKIKLLCFGVCGHSFPHLSFWSLVKSFAVRRTQLHDYITHIANIVMEKRRLSSTKRFIKVAKRPGVCKICVANIGLCFFPPLPKTLCTLAWVRSDPQTCQQRRRQLLTGAEISLHRFSQSNAGMMYLSAPEALLQIYRHMRLCAELMLCVSVCLSSHKWMLQQPGCVCGCECACAHMHCQQPPWGPAPGRQSVRNRLIYLQTAA